MPAILREQPRSDHKKDVATTAGVKAALRVSGVYPMTINELLVVC